MGFVITRQSIYEIRYFTFFLPELSRKGMLFLFSKVTAVIFYHLLQIMSAIIRCMVNYF